LTFGKIMSAALQALAVMIALLWLPEGMTQFTISHGQENGSTEKIFGVKLHDGYWRVTSAKNPQGTDYRVKDGDFTMRNWNGRVFSSKIDQDLDWSGADLKAAETEVVFRHSAMGSPLKISRGIPGGGAMPSVDRFLTVLQESGWVRGFLVNYSKTDEDNVKKNAEPDGRGQPPTRPEPE
jgi:hypothetical protein